MTTTGDYVLGTHDAEIARLGMQHDVWRARVTDAWQRAGIAAGATVLDVGCGPGFASLDLAAIVGPTGRVAAIDRSPRFLDALGQAAAARGLAQIAPILRDLDDAGDLPISGADGAWARWVFAFVTQPRELLARVARALRPGGVFVAHEYFDYRTWRAVPREPGVEELVAHVMRSWRARGGEPDIALDLVGWLPAFGFEIASLRPMIEVAGPGSPYWRWAETFADVGLKRLVALGEVTAEHGAELAAAWAAVAARPGSYIVTPGVLEIIAVRR